MFRDYPPYYYTVEGKGSDQKLEDRECNVSNCSERGWVFHHGAYWCKKHRNWWGWTS